MLEGNEEGIVVWNKLGNSTDGTVQSYFRSLQSVAQKYYSVYFSDLEEQKKVKLNNQKTFYMSYNKNDQKWHVTLFHEPINVVR